MKCRNCFNYIAEYCEELNDIRDANDERDCVFFKPLTNGDRMRRMNDEELAAIIMCPYELDYGSCIGNGLRCIDCCKRYLAEEVRE